MIDLKRITKGKKETPPRVLIYGADGVGKTKFAAGAPNPFFIDLNRGSLAYDVNRVFASSWTETLEWIGAVEGGAVKCDTLVIDALGDLEHMANLEFFGGTTIDKYEGGYGKGDTVSITRWRELLAATERVWSQGKTIVMVGHMQVKAFKNPDGPSYDRYQLALRDKLGGLLKQWHDYVFYAQEEVVHQKVGDGTRAATTGVRYLRTRRTAAFDAKSRGSTLFPEQIPLSWEEFIRERAADADRTKQFQLEIESMLVEMGDKKLEEQVRSYNKAHPEMIVESHNRMKARYEEFKNKPATATTAPAPAVAATAAQ